jgi:hypothetical protein
MPADTPTQAAQYRQLAEDIRTLVPTWSDPETRAELEWMAACYERLADFTDQAAKRQQFGDSQKLVH